MNSTQKIEVIWIDDEFENRKKDAEILGKRNSDLSLKMIHPSKFLKILEKADLYIIDYFLGRVQDKDSKEKFQYNGFTIAGMIRDLYPEHPIYGTTAEYSEENGNFAKVSNIANEIFDGLLSLQRIQNEGHEILYHDAIDYMKIREIEKNKVERLFDLLQVPSNIREQLQLALPSELKRGLAEDNKDSAIAFAKWIKDIFIKTPGFLYNNLYAATHLGMKRSIFEKEIYNIFNDASYKGIFSKTNEPLWWVTKLTSILFSLKESEELDIVHPWAVGSKIFGLSNDQISKCAKCGENLPETVGTNLKNKKEETVHYRCSMSHPYKKRQLYFDDPRAFE